MFLDAKASFRGGQRIKLQKPYASGKRFGHSPDNGRLGRSKDAKMTPPVTSTGINGPPQRRKKSGDGLGLIEDCHLTKQAEFMSGILRKPEPEQRQFKILVVGVWNGGSGQGCFTHLARPHEDDGWEQAGEFP